MISTILLLHGALLAASPEAGLPPATSTPPTSVPAKTAPATSPASTPPTTPSTPPHAPSPTATTATAASPAPATAPPAVPPAAPPATPPTPPAVTAQDLQVLQQRVDEVTEAQKQFKPNELNPSIGLVGETIFSYHRRNSALSGNDRPGGFDVFQRSVETNVSGWVDPFAKAYAVINASADPITDEANLDVEEAALETRSLPWNLTVLAGRFFGEFGRLAYIHDHELPFVNRPLVLDRYIGGESQTDGLQVNWLAPTDQYISLTVGAGDRFGTPPNNIGSFRSFDGLNFWGRLSTYFDVTDNWELETGISALWNPSEIDRNGGTTPQPDTAGFTQTEKQRRLAGVDVRLSYVPLQTNMFHSFVWGTEVLASDNRYLGDNTTPSAEHTVHAYGLYSYALLKLSRRWTVGFQFDGMEDPQDASQKTYAFSPQITLVMSHFDQLRLQYTRTNHNAATGLVNDDAVFLQWAWIIGSHAHGWQQR